MKNKLIIALSVIVGVVLFALCSALPVSQHVRYQVQYAKAGDRLVVNVLSRDFVKDSQGNTLYLYSVKGRYDTKTFCISSWNVYSPGTEQELSEDDSIDGSF